MTVTSLLPVRVWKEFRGLSPAWLACLASIAVAAALGGQTRALGLFAYVLGAVAVGALSMGQEYNSRTLTLLLSQPARRERLFLEKLGLLAAMLLVLSAVAWLALFEPQWGGGVGSANNRWFLVFALPLLCGLFVAPWLTMVCRSALAGVVFAAAIPGIVWVTSDVASAMTYGGDLSATIEAHDFALDIFWRGTLIVCVIAAASSWRMFMRLEAIDSRGGEVGLPSWLAWLGGRSEPIAAAPAFARRHAMWLLAKKELRLQHLTFAVSGLYVLGWVAVLWLKEVSPATKITLLYGSTVFHSGAIALLAGSLASAEERQLGTLEWQVLLPMAAWKQWLMKASVASGIALTLTLGLPALLFYFSATPAIRGELGPLTSASIGYAIVPIVVASLYISTLCANGLRALLISVPVVFVLMVVAGLLFTTTQFFGPGYPTMFMMWRQWFRIYSQSSNLLDGRLFILYITFLNVLVTAIYAGALALLLKFALTNHRSAERGTGRVWKQMTGLVAFLAIGMTLWGGVFRLYAAESHERNRIWRLQFATVAGVVMDSGHNLVKDYTVVILPENRDQWSSQGRFYDANPQGEFATTFLRPGRYSFIAVEKLERGAQGDPELLDRLKALAVPVTLAAGDSKAISLMLTRF